MEKTTKRAMYEAIAEAMETGSCKFAPEVVKEFCMNEIELLDKKAAKAKERAASKASEGDALTDAVMAVMTTDEFQPIATIAANVANEDATVAKCTYRLTQLVKNGLAEKQEITVGGGEGSKARKVQGYRKLTV
ncbi:MAG: hypothetical protein PHE51_12170 [Eubacteriales bacterium]|nr:hypothetical protein [Eubacteriales bacterium]